MFARAAMLPLQPVYADNSYPFVCSVVLKNLRLKGYLALPFTPTPPTKRESRHHYPFTWMHKTEGKGEGLRGRNGIGPKNTILQAQKGVQAGRNGPFNSVNISTRPLNEIQLVWGRLASKHHVYPLREGGEPVQHCLRVLMGLIQPGECLFSSIFHISIQLPIRVNSQSCKHIFSSSNIQQWFSWYRN